MWYAPLETAKIIFSNRKRVEQQGGHFCSPAYTPPERRLGYAEARRSVEICRLPRFYQQSGKWKGTREGERGKRLTKSETRNVIQVSGAPALFSDTGCRRGSPSRIHPPSFFPCTSRSSSDAYFSLTSFFAPFRP